jgi:hypothetical protein
MKVSSMLALVLAAAALAQAAPQTPAAPSAPAAPADAPKLGRRFHIGGRVTGYLLDLTPKGKTEFSLDSPRLLIVDDAKSKSSRFGYGLVTEFRFTERFSLGVEGILHKVGYEQETTTSQGANLQFTTTRKEITNANQWDIPPYVRMTGLKEEGWLSRATVSLGAATRLTTRVRTQNSYRFPNGTTAEDSIPTTPNKNRVPGAIASFGFRFVDDFNLKATPEVRYIRWFGSAFDIGAMRMRRDQLEISLAITF